MLPNKLYLILTATTIGKVWANRESCAAPEPSYQICYNTGGGTSQDIDLRDLQYTARYLRKHSKGKTRPFWTMPVKAADNCGEWQVTTKGTVMILAKLLVDADASITFDDIATTIDGGENASPEAKARSLLGCGIAGGQMGAIVNGSDPYYRSAAFTSARLVNFGIVIKAVRNSK